MKRIIYFGILLILLILPQDLLAQNKQTTLDALVRNLGEKFIVDAKAMGLSIGVYADGTEYFYNFGTSIKDKAITPTQNTVYEVGSITKTLVSFIITCRDRKQSKIGG